MSILHHGISILGSAVFVWGLCAQNAEAAFITSNTLVSPTTVDFGQFVASPVAFVDGPIQIGGLVGEDIEFTGSPNTGLYAHDGHWGLLDNGTWETGSNGYIASDNLLAEIIITFNDAPVSGVGAFMNYCPDNATFCPGSNLIISVYDTSDVLLETYDVTALADIATPGGLNAGAFRGIERTANEIGSFRISGATAPLLDDLAFSRVVPEPSTAFLLSAGLVGLAAHHRRRNA